MPRGAAAERVNSMIVFTIFGAVFAAIGAGLLLHRKKLRRLCTVETEAAIIGVERVESENTERDSDGRERTTTSITYAPVYRYQADGQQVEKRSPVSSSRYPAVGAVVPLFYNPDEVTQFYVPTDKGTKHIGVFFVAMGAAFILFGIFL